MTFVAESIPQDTLKTLLETYWMDSQEVPTPNIVIVNDPEGEMLYANYTGGDYIMIAMSGSEGIRYRGNIKYYDKNFPILINIGTKESRQRLRDIWKMTRGQIYLFDYN